MTSTGSGLVHDVISAMKRGSDGDGDALDALKRSSDKSGTATETAPTATAEKLHTVEETFILRPNGEKYYIRKLGKHHDVAVLRRARSTGINPLLTGPPGTGKTALLEAAYCPTGKVHTVQGTGDTETADFVGGYTQMPGGEFVWVDGPLVLAMDNGEVLYIDEIALIDPRVLALVYGVMDGRNELLITANPDRGVIKAKDGFFVVAACNPNAPGARMSEALLSRFDLQFEVTTDYVLAKRLGVDPTMITAATNMQKKVDSGAMSWAPQLRELIAFKKITDEFGVETAIRNMVTTAPEMDRSSAADVISRTFSKSYKGLRLA